jgi:hypothetical protein
MTRLGILLFATLLVFFPSLHNSCSRPPDTKGTSTLGNPVTPSQAAPQILTAVCSVLTRCNTKVTNAACMSGVRSTSGIDQRLGLSIGAFSNYSSIISAEQTGNILASPVSTTECLSDLTALDCASPEVTGAYNASAPEPYAGVRDMLDRWRYSCAGVFNPDAILFADGFESGDGSALNSEDASASYPQTSAVPGGCRSGEYCGAQSLRRNVGDEEAAWNKFVYFMPDHGFVRAFYKFPADWQFTLNDNRDFQIMQLGWGGCSDAIILGFRSRGGDGRSADLLTYSVRTLETVHMGNNFVPDGQWHSVELYSSFTDRVIRVWFDGNLVIDATDLAGSCAAGEVQIGAYVGPSALLPKNEMFYVDDIAISRQRLGP